MATEEFYFEEGLPDWLRVSAASIAGTRTRQEDALLYEVCPDGVLGIVCDGMGGLGYGDVGSLAASEEIRDFFRRTPRPDLMAGPDSDKKAADRKMRDYWIRAMRAADRTVSELVTETGKPLMAGTTCAAVFLTEDAFYWASCGDSMIWLIRNGKSTELVRRHNYRLELTEELAEHRITDAQFAEQSADGDALISYLGMHMPARVDTGSFRRSVSLRPGDRILLASDGLYKALTEEAIAQIAEGIPEDLFEYTAFSMVREALKEPDRELDNTTVLCFLYQ